MTRCLLLLFVLALPACEPADDPAGGPVCEGTIDGTPYRLEQKSSSQSHEDYDLFLVGHASINLVFGAAAELALTVHLNSQPTAEDVGTHTIPGNLFDGNLVEDAVLLNPARFATVDGETLTIDSADGSRVKGSVRVTLAGRGSLDCGFDVPVVPSPPSHSDPHDASDEDPDIDIDWD